jgi:hypothetical protein
MTQIFMCRMLIEIESHPVNHIFILRKTSKKQKATCKIRKVKKSPIVDCHLDFVVWLQQCMNVAGSL